ncbi:MAG: zf-HC2 domain-containing protein [Marinilabiliaceae bacterium]|nr:zf-HC2 domain-containing protein [Marinilabiliaceae bacterium]
MNCSDIHNRLLEFLDGTLTKEDHTLFEQHLESCDNCLEELRRTKQLMALMEKSPDVEPPMELDLKVSEMIKKEQQQIKKAPVTIHIHMNWRQIAAAVLIFVTGALSGKFLLTTNEHGKNTSQVAALQSEMDDMRQLLMFAMLRQDSPSERLKAVYFTEDINQFDDNVLSALFNTLNADENVNVRLAAANALMQHSQSAAVRQGLIEALEQQTEPLIQIVLIQSLVALKDKNVVPVVERFIDNDQVHATVQDEAQKAINILL